MKTKDFEPNEQTGKTVKSKHISITPIFETLMIVKNGNNIAVTENIAT